jgi:hypothetical protein
MRIFLRSTGFPMMIHPKKENSSCKKKTNEELNKMQNMDKKQGV